MIEDINDRTAGQNFHLSQKTFNRKYVGRTPLTLGIAGTSFLVTGATTFTETTLVLRESCESPITISLGESNLPNEYVLTVPSEVSDLSFNIDLQVSSVVGSSGKTYYAIYNYIGCNVGGYFEVLVQNL